MEREVHEEGGKERNPCHILVGENPYSCWSWSKHAIQASARARDYVLELSNLVKGLRSYTRGMYSSV